MGPITNSYLQTLIPGAWSHRLPGTRPGHPPAAKRDVEIIPRRTRRLQGKTVTGLWQRQRKLSDVASAHHFGRPPTVTGHGLQTFSSPSWQSDQV